MKVTTDACLFGAWVSKEISGQAPAPKKILDIGTGTGLLSLMLAQQNPVALIDAVEKDKDAALQAVENIAASAWANRIKIIHADAMQFDYSTKYDVIISNPPFYENELKGSNAKKHLAHHDEGLLLPGLLSIIKKNLDTSGRFYLLLPFKRNEEIRKLFSNEEMVIRKIVFIKQSEKHGFFRLFIEGDLNIDNQTETAIDEISVAGKNGEYTSSFKSQLKDYYLHL